MAPWRLLGCCLTRYERSCFPPRLARCAVGTGSSDVWSAGSLRTGPSKTQPGITPSTSRTAAASGFPLSQTSHCVLIATEVSASLSRTASQEPGPGKGGVWDWTPLQLLRVGISAYLKQFWRGISGVASAADVVEVTPKVCHDARWPPMPLQAILLVASLPSHLLLLFSPASMHRAGKLQGD